MLISFDAIADRLLFSAFSKLQQYYFYAVQAIKKSQRWLSKYDFQMAITCRCGFALYPPTNFTWRTERPEDNIDFTVPSDPSDDTRNKEGEYHLKMGRQNTRNTDSTQRKEHSVYVYFLYSHTFFQVNGK
ncbi:MAG: hypothetical protein H7A00_00795 [Hahellaceae bacterium]|nr:hypothetical protein [Hahellaceae bacterium]